MNIITPKPGNITERSRIRKITNPPNNYKGMQNVSFRAANPKALLTTADEHILKVFSQHYGKAGSFLIDKTDDLIKESKVLEKSSRFFQQNGHLAVKDKNIPTSLLENIIFPFITLPLYAANWIIKKAQSIPGLKNGAEKLYNKALFRIPRKLNNLNESTNQIKGILGKTQSTVESFIKEKGLKMSPQELMEKLSNADDSPIVKEASDYIKENLYKASNKFFDKHTGNFNTAYERPLNRIVTGLIPVAFLANDAYNLSVLCGDKKEDSQKEAHERTRQEISRVLTTAYIQLLTFGAFTKQVNTLSWFTPLTSAATVLFSEISSRKRLGKPVFFLSKEQAKEYNKKEAEKSDGKEDSSKTNQPKETDNKSKIEQVPVQKNNIVISSQTEPQVFACFKGTSKEEPKEEKSKPAERKALMNADTFKKGLILLITGGFAMSFLKNSSLTKNTKIMQGLNKFKDFCKKKIYDPLAFKTFEIKTSEFDDLMKVLDDIGCKEIADGHRFIKDKYKFVGSGVEAANVIKMQKGSISGSGIQEIAKSITSSLQDVAENDIQKIIESVKTAIKQEGTAVSEMKYDRVAKKAAEIIKNKNINISEEKLTSLTSTITEAMKANGKTTLIKVDTKLKPFVDIVTEPFKFIMAAVNLPFKLVKTAINLVTSPIQKKAAKALLGQAQLTKFEKAINTAVVEVFGKKEAKAGKISQTIFANAMEQLQKQTAPYRKAKEALEAAKRSGHVDAKTQEAFDKAKDELYKYVNRAVQKSFDGVTQSSNKNTDLAMMTKLASSAVTSAFLVADNYNMVMIKSDGEDTRGAKEKASERIIQRLSALFYQSMLINWFNSTFRATYNSSLKGMTAVAIPNTLTTEILTRKSIGMPVGKKSYEELQEIDEKNENRTGFLGKYFKFMRLLTGKKPLKDRLPKDKAAENAKTIVKPEITGNVSTTNLLEIFANK